MVSQQVRSALADDLRGDTEVPLFLLEEPLFADVLRWRMGCVARFLGEVRDLVRSLRPTVKLGAALVPPVKIGHDFTAPRSWLGAQSYRYFAPAVDTLHCVVHWEAPAVEYDTRRARDQMQAAKADCELCVHLPAYGRFRPDDVQPMTEAALRQGADSICYFCHDLLDEPTMQAIAETVRTLQATR
jgi:hypothetical protein